MTIITPLLYQLRARRRLAPSLRFDATLDAYASEFSRERGLPLAELDEWALDNRLEPFLEPFPFGAARDQAVSGVPLLPEVRLRQLLSGAKETYGASRGRWWEFHRTDTGDYAMFPGDDESDVRVQVARLEKSGPAVQMRRLDTMVELDRRRMNVGFEPAIVDEHCVHEVHGVDEGAPYTGRCANEGCARGCSPRLSVHPDDGVYRLLGCDC